MRRSTRQRILDVLHPDSGGERKRLILDALVGKDAADKALKQLRAEGLVSMRFRYGGPHYRLTRRAMS